MLCQTGLLTKGRCRLAGRNGQAAKDVTEEGKLLTRERLLAQEILITKIKAPLTKLSLDLARRLHVDKALNVHLLLLTAKAPKEPGCFQILLLRCPICRHALKAKLHTRLLCCDVGLLRLLTELLFCLPSRVFLLLGRQPKARCFLSRLLSELEDLVLELLLLLTRLLSGLKR